MTETEPRRTDTEPRSIFDEYAWALPIILGTAALSLLIYLEPAWGANAAASLGFLVGVVGIVVSILIDRGYFRTSRLPGALRRWQKKTVAASTAVRQRVLTASDNDSHCQRQ